MVVEKEGTFEVGGAQSLYTKSWLPDGPTKAKLIFTHGFSDHVNRYGAFFTALAQRGVAVHGFDQRGWGRSVRKPAEKGLTGPTSQVLADIVAFLKPHLEGQESVFVMGHSMGGGQVLTLLGEQQYEDSVLKKVRGWLLESPFVSFSPEEQPSWFKILAGRLAGRLLPHHQLVHKITPENLTRDPAVVESIKKDDLMHDTGTLAGLSGLLDRTTALAKGSVRPRKGGVVKALWIGHGTRDKTTLFDAAKKYFDECTGDVEDREFRAYEGWYHQLHADGPDSEEIGRAHV